jgi:hypothetical protein
MNNKATIDMTATTAKKKTVEVPIEFLRGLIKTIRADMEFQPGLAVSQWVKRLEGLLKDGGRP